MTFPIQAYVQQLETSRLKLIQIEQELDRARQQVRRTLALLLSKYSLLLDSTKIEL